MAARKDLIAFKSASYTCQECGRTVARAEKPKTIYAAFIRLKYCGYACSVLASRKGHEERFWSKVEKTDRCWLWTGGCDDKGYGVHHRAGRKIRAHRYSYELHNGPCGDLHVLHSCDNPPCVNPAHLRAGTALENMRDAKLRRRFDRRKELPHPTAKLTPSQVEEIRASAEVGARLARKYGVSKSTIYAVRNGQNWQAG